ncbi:F0F1 ATP synthase subunit delta [Cohnella sp. REN36]|uniref:F0F1 ATP synthase subunit delta n=1 Tax=Cohnella sp. REN36 TaxID=2887347 RepID=UPI001D134ABB|nr:F0F1 ATP synthase subunit delta [Cohnella sp. REN36]MCC3377175.1 F0F1 ATP synthase subunit delta [Cohnella sp. REN36]
MSRGSVVAKRYAKALFDLAREQDLVVAAENELKAISDTVTANADVRAFLAAPNITFDKKIEALRASFGGKVSQIVLNTIILLIERGRQGEIPALLEAYRQVAGDELGRIDAKVTSAKPLTDEEKSRLAAQFGGKIGKTVRVDNTVDPSILGGLTVRIGDTLYDGSLRGKLDRLSKELQATV